MTNFMTFYIFLFLSPLTFVFAQNSSNSTSTNTTVDLTNYTELQPFQLVEVTFKSQYISSLFFLSFDLILETF